MNITLLNRLLYEVDRSANFPMVTLFQIKKKSHYKCFERSQFYKRNIKHSVNTVFCVKTSDKEYFTVRVSLISNVAKFITTITYIWSRYERLQAISIARFWVIDAGACSNHQKEGRNGLELLCFLIFNIIVYNIVAIVKSHK